MHIGENIIRLRKEKKMTQEELANLVFVSPKTVSSWEKERNLPNIETLILLADIFNTDINTILGLNLETSKDIQKAYKKKNQRKLILLIIILILNFLFFINVQESGISFIIGKYNYNNKIISLTDILAARQFMYSYNMYYILYIIIISVLYLFYKKKWKYPLIIISGLFLILCTGSILSSIVQTNYDFYDYFISNANNIIIFIINLLAFINGIKLFKQSRKIKSKVK